MTRLAEPAHGAHRMTMSAAPFHPPSRDRTLRAIIAYKFVKGIAALALAAALSVLIGAGYAPRVDASVARLAHHMTGAWSLHLARLLEGALESNRLWLAVVALACDGTLTTIEGWALHRGHRWGEWLVVLATGSLLPFEVYEIAARGPHPWRVALLAVNALVVAYLARRIRRERRADRAAS